MDEPRGFPDTTWGMVARVRGRGEDRRLGLETLCRRYWEPIRSYARAAWARSDDDANDLAQDFFVWLLDGNEVLSKFSPELGSFRHFLKGLLRNFGRNARQASRAEKRGGGKSALPLTDAHVPGREDERLAAAEKAFDMAWVLEVTRRALERVRLGLEGTQKAYQWRAFEEYDLRPPAERLTYEALATRLGVSESDVRNGLFAVREKVRAEVRTELCDTVATQRDLEEELRQVIGA